MFRGFSIKSVLGTDSSTIKRQRTLWQSQFVFAYPSTDSKKEYKSITEHGHLAGVQDRSGPGCPFGDFSGGTEKSLGPEAETLLCRRGQSNSLRRAKSLHRSRLSAKQSSRNNARYKKRVVYRSIHDPLELDAYGITGVQ